MWGQSKRSYYGAPFKRTLTSRRLAPASVACQHQRGATPIKRCWNEETRADHWTLFEAEGTPGKPHGPGAGRRCGLAEVLSAHRALRSTPPARQRPGPALVGEPLLTPPAAWLDPGLTGRSSRHDGEQVRALFGFRPIGGAGEDPLCKRLESEAVLTDVDTRHLPAADADWVRGHQREPPADDRRCWSRLRGGLLRHQLKPLPRRETLPTPRPYPSSNPSSTSLLMVWLSPCSGCSTAMAS